MDDDREDILHNIRMVDRHIAALCRKLRSLKSNDSSRPAFEQALTKANVQRDELHTKLGGATARNQTEVSR